MVAGSNSIWSSCYGFEFVFAGSNWILVECTSWCRYLDVVGCCVAGANLNFVVLVAVESRLTLVSVGCGLPGWIYTFEMIFGCLWDANLTRCFALALDWIIFVCTFVVESIHLHSITFFYGGGLCPPHPPRAPLPLDPTRQGGWLPPLESPAPLWLPIVCSAASSLALMHGALLAAAGTVHVVGNSRGCRFESCSDQRTSFCTITL